MQDKIENGYLTAREYAESRAIGLDPDRARRIGKEASRLHREAGLPVQETDTQVPGGRTLRIRRYAPEILEQAFQAVRP